MTIKYVEQLRLRLEISQDVVLSSAAMMKP